MIPDSNEHSHKTENSWSIKFFGGKLASFIQLGQISAPQINFQKF